MATMPIKMGTWLKMLSPEIDKRRHNFSPLFMRIGKPLSAGLLRSPPLRFLS